MIVEAMSPPYEIRHSAYVGLRM
ncbi:hypothetical protein SBRY_30358 [Actinacidiphila bryophytorum]|uniref:Uncharacterized protein n=1 Tax=Actinacidiphila bryophytorum TaxID=1436133 RepID=A0A9W4H0W1_9ACTN|nr:hypothetical protein SBRY_30358 [Actinacidiphila bryophytorum]